MNETCELHNKFIAIVGYPKSGNTYLSRLTGDILNSPVGGWKNANPLATEGEERLGEYYVAQLHLRPTYDLSVEEAVPDGWRYNTARASGERIIHIVRDPRDIAVSAKFYWDLPDIRTTLDAMASGLHPFVKNGSWNDFIRDWMSIPEKGFKIEWVLYESLLHDPYFTIKYVLLKLGLPFPDIPTVCDCIDRQLFENKRNIVKKDGDVRPYGKTIQLKLMRKGIAGDWKNHFTQEDSELALEYFGETMRLVGYGEE